MDNNSTTKLEPGSYCGSDEIGKIETLKQLTVVSVYVDKNHFTTINELGVNDSKKLSESKIKTIGEKLTGFKKYSDIKSEEVVEKKDEYGLVFCPIIYTNKEYNEYKNKNNENNENKYNANKLLSELHNTANLKVINHLNKDKEIIKNVVIDDFIHQNDSVDRFYDTYLEDITEKLPKDIIVLETKADSTYKTIVGTASIICAYIDILWQNHLNEVYGKKLNYGNTVDQVTESLNILKEKNGLVYAKNTKIYTEWEKEWKKS